MQENKSVLVNVNGCGYLTAFKIVGTFQPFLNDGEIGFSGKGFKREIADRNSCYGIIYITASSLFQRSHSGKMTRNATCEIRLQMLFKGMNISKPFLSFVFEVLSYLEISIIDHIIFCFIFSIYTLFKGKLMQIWKSPYTFKFIQK